MPEPVKYVLPESEIPTHWTNLMADLGPPPHPPLHPGTQQPLGPEDLAPLFPMALIEQEMSSEPEIEIPDEVREIYAMWRPTPLFRARRLEKALDTPAHIYYKYEGVSPAGSHKVNTAIPQAYYNKAEGIRKLTTETGAGQWGSALSHACGIFELECEVRYHGDASAVCALAKDEVIEAQAITQTDAFGAAVRFGRTEGILPAPEPAHAIKVTIDEALDAKEKGEERVILFNLCGHGYFDMAAYDQYHRGELEDLEFSEDDMLKALERLPQAPALT